VTGAEVNVDSKYGKFPGKMISDNTATFSSSIMVQGNEYPLLQKVYGGIELVTWGPIIHGNFQACPIRAAPVNIIYSSVTRR
jgi:hypothetical protein